MSNAYNSVTPLDNSTQNVALGNQKKSLRVFCVVFNAMGHFNPMCNVATALIEAGHTVTLLTCEDPYIKEKAKVYAEPFGVKMIYAHESDQDFMIKQPEGCNDPMNEFLKAWHPKVAEQISAHRDDIDVIVADHMAYPAIITAKNLNIPCIINAPAPFFFYQEWGFQMPNMKSATSCCGMVCVCGTMIGCAMNTIMTQTNDYQMKFWKTRYDHVWACNSFFGLEPAQPLPPNIQLIGTIDKEPEALMENLQKKDIDLFNWLEEAKANNEDVVYVSLGSLVRWQKWTVNTIYQGLKNIGCKVVWGLPDKYHELFDEDPKTNPKFWIRGWQPQVEVLNHAAVKAGMTHCGWGGIMEFIGAGVPLVAFAHFGDQHVNAKLVTDGKAGVELYNQEASNPMDVDQNLSRLDPVFDQAKVEECFKKVLTDQVYKTNMMKLQALSRMERGRKKIVDIVEKAACVGTEHLTDPHLREKMLSLSCCFSNFFILVMLYFTVHYIYLMVDKYALVDE